MREPTRHNSRHGHLAIVDRSYGRILSRLGEIMTTYRIRYSSWLVDVGGMKQRNSPMQMYVCTACTLAQKPTPLGKLFDEGITSQPPSRPYLRLGKGNGHCWISSTLAVMFWGFLSQGWRTPELIFTRRCTLKRSTDEWPGSTAGRSLVSPGRLFAPLEARKLLNQVGTAAAVC